MNSCASSLKPLRLVIRRTATASTAVALGLPSPRWHLVALRRDLCSGFRRRLLRCMDRLPSDAETLAIVRGATKGAKRARIERGAVTLTQLADVAAYARHQYPKSADSLAAASAFQQAACLNGSQRIRSGLWYVTSRWCWRDQ